MNQVSGSYELKNVQVTSFNPAKHRVNKSHNGLVWIEGLRLNEWRKIPVDQ